MISLVKPVITEKSMISARNGLYTFEVLLGATKPQVRTEVEAAFKVKVTSVNILRRHVPAKATGSKRLTGNPGKTKYAILRLIKGQSIDLFDLKEDK
jgi:large subunit ribosomal protein L23